MTFSAFELSVDSGQPVELYEFDRNATKYRYTNADETITLPAGTFTSLQITRTQATQELQDRTRNIQITMPASNALAQEFISIVPSLRLSLTIYRLHRTDTDEETIVVWRGYIAGVSFQKDGIECIMQGVSAEFSFSRAIPRFTYQGLCNHVLYDSGCTLNKASYTYAGNVANVDGNDITVQGLSSKGAGWALGGYAMWNSGQEFRMVLEQSGDIITVLLPFPDDVSSSTLTVYAGCDHTIGTCNSKFSNAINFGGFPYVPTLNPFTAGLDV